MHSLSPIIRWFRRFPVQRFAPQYPNPHPPTEGTVDKLNMWVRTNPADWSAHQARPSSAWCTPSIHAEIRTRRFRMLHC